MIDKVERNNCPIIEETGDGVSVGRCWFYCWDGICPRHGDVSEYLQKLPNLTPEKEMISDRAAKQKPNNQFDA